MCCIARPRGVTDLLVVGLVADRQSVHPPERRSQQSQPVTRFVIAATSQQVIQVDRVALDTH
jgi:hypothetical protein